jgi:hypothetical protein
MGAARAGGKGEGWGYGEGGFRQESGMSDRVEAVAVSQILSRQRCTERVS